jgi:predicted small lipoprotein YifL
MKKNSSSFFSFFILLFSLFLLAGCGGKAIYVPPAGGAPIEVDEQTAYMLIQRDIQLAAIKSMGKANLKPEQTLSFAMLAQSGRLSSIKAPVHWSEAIQNVGNTALLNTLFGGAGWFANSHKEVDSVAYVMTGNNNSISGINNKTSAQRDAVTSVTSTPYGSSNQETTETSYKQEDTEDSVNGLGSYDNSTDNSTSSTE